MLDALGSRFMVRSSVPATTGQQLTLAIRPERIRLAAAAPACDGRVDVPEILRATGIEVRTLDDLREAMAGIFERNAPNAIAVKAQHAYTRTLHWEERSDGDAARALATQCIAGIEPDVRRLDDALARNPILATALNPAIGYERAAAIAKRAYAEGRPVLEVALEMSGVDEAELRRLLDPAALTRGGLHGGGGGGG